MAMEMEIPRPVRDGLVMLVGTQEWESAFVPYLECVHRKLLSKLEDPNTDDRESALLRGECRRIRTLKRMAQDLLTETRNGSAAPVTRQ
jgi:hypothetical protein